MRSFRRAPGVVLRPLGEGWAAFSGLSGESHLLNEESVAVIELLDTEVGRDEQHIAQALSSDCGIPVAELAASLAQGWSSLLDAGLVLELTSAPRG